MGLHRVSWASTRCFANPEGGVARSKGSTLSGGPDRRRARPTARIRANGGLCLVHTLLANRRGGNGLTILDSSIPTPKACAGPRRFQLAVASDDRTTSPTSLCCSLTRLSRWAATHEAATRDAAFACLEEIQCDTETSPDGVSMIS